MEKILKYIAEQNRYFDPKDSLSELVNQILSLKENELGEDELFFVQAARGSDVSRIKKTIKSLEFRKCLKTAGKMKSKDKGTAYWSTHIRERGLGE